MVQNKTKNFLNGKIKIFGILVGILVVFLLSLGESANASCGSSENIFDNGVWWIKKSEDNKFECINIYLNGTYKGKSSKLVFGHKVAGFDSWPEVAVFYPSGFIRLKQATYPDIKFGTSIVLGPAYWNESEYAHNPRITEIKINTTNLPSKIIVDMIGILPNFNVNYNIQIFEPTNESIKIYVKQTYNCTKQFVINSTRFAQHEGFKLVQFSSMYINDTFHDSDGAKYIDKDNNLNWVNFSNIGKNIFIFQTPKPMGQNWIESTHSDNFGWQNNTPNVIIKFEDLSIIRHITPQGWIKDTLDYNDDNVGLWAHYDASITNWNVGDSKTVTFWVIAQDDPISEYNLSKATCIFDAVEILEYLSGKKNLLHEIDSYDLNSDKRVDLFDVITLIQKILID